MPVSAAKRTASKRNGNRSRLTTKPAQSGTSTARFSSIAASACARMRVSGNVPVEVATFPTSANRRYGAVVESLGANPAQIVVERAQDRDANGVPWAAGTNASATKLQ